MASAVTLSHNNKENIGNVSTSVPTISFKEVKSFGQERLDGWGNMLIFGDNLIALKILLKDSKK